MDEAPKDTEQLRLRLRLGELEVDRLTMGGALDAIEALVAARAGGFVVTPNVDHVMLAERSAEFRAAYGAAALSLADGVPILWAATLLDTALPEKVSGSDLTAPLVERAAALGWRVFLLGGAPGVAEEAARRLHLRYGVNVVGTAAPLIRLEGDGDETASALAHVTATRPDLLLVALGAPKQEIWLHRHCAELAPAVAVGVGASLDFVAGRVRRAPRWMSRIGLEWLWRLAREPRRLWRRYLVDDVGFAWVVWRELSRRRASRRRGAPPQAGPASSPGLDGGVAAVSQPEPSPRSRSE